jgi:hypothetical protein
MVSCFLGRNGRGQYLQAHALCLKMIKRLFGNPERFEKVLRDHVYALVDTYAMTE